MGELARAIFRPRIWNLYLHVASCLKSENKKALTERKDGKKREQEKTCFESTANRTHGIDRYAVSHNMVWPCTCEGKFCFSHLTYCDSDMIFQFFCSLFVATRYDVDGCLNLGPSEIGYHVHLADNSTRVGVLPFAVLHRAGER